MSIDNKAVIVVALPYGELKDLVDIDECVRTEKLTMFSLYFDAPYEDSLFGYVLAETGGNLKIDLFDLDRMYMPMFTKFQKEFKVAPNLYLATYSY